MKRWMNNGWLVFGLFGIAGLLVYGAALGNGLVIWDDNYLVSGNPLIRTISPSTLWYAFSSFDPELYIPLTIVSYQIGYLLAGPSPVMVHGMNLLLHVLNAFLIYRVIGRLSDDAKWGVVAGLLFVVHPLHTEAVMWASARKDVLSAFFGLLAFDRYLTYVDMQRGRDLGISIAMFACGLLAKVSIAPLAVLIPLSRWAAGKPMRMREVAIDVAFFAPPAVVLGVVAIIGKHGVQSPLSAFQTLILWCKSVGFSVWHFFAPADLSPIYQHHGAVTLLDPGIAFGVVFVGALCAAAFALRKKNVLAAYAIVFGLTLCVPSAVTFAKSGYLYLTSDRYAYLPSMGILLGLIVMARAWIRQWNTILITTFALSAGLGAISIQQARVWESSVSLFEHAVALDPLNPQILNNLGVAYKDRKEFDRAMQQFRKILELQPYAKAWINIGNLHREQGDNETALQDYANAAAADPKDPESHFARGALLAEMKRSDEALVEFQEALQRDATHTPAMNNVAGLLIQAGKLDEARDILEKLLKINPYYSDAHFNLAVVYQAEKRPEDAATQYIASLDAQPTLTIALLRSTELLIGLQRYEEATAILKRAIDADRHSAENAKVALSAIQQILTAEKDEPHATKLLQHLMNIGIVKKK